MRQRGAASQKTVIFILNVVFLFSEFKNDKEMVGDVILTLTALIVRNEFCQMVDEAGGITFIMDVLVSYPDSEVNRSHFMCKANVGTVKKLCQL
jgi:hypothetical protein